MKKLLITLLLVPSFANAGFCDAVYDFAEATMKMRQEGYTKTQAKIVVEETKQYSELLAKVLDANVDWAYSVPVYKDDRKNTVANEFANQSYDMCRENGF